MKKHILSIQSLINRPFIFGTIMLTTATLLTRVIGFFYKIFLSRIFSEECLGIISLTAPIMMITNAICTTGIQNAITRFVASEKNHKNNHKYSYLFNGLALSLGLSFLMTNLVYNNSTFIATHILKESRCIPLLKINALSFPFIAIHNCLNGFFYGHRKTSIPSLSLIIEQLTRVFTVYILYTLTQNIQANMSLSFVCLGMFFGEVSSSFFSSLALIIHSHKLKPASCQLFSIDKSISIIKLSTPLSLNRIFISILNTIETIQLPQMLVLSGMSSSTALSIYGVFTGMAFPLIMFPCAITNAASSLLLPTISEAQSCNNPKLIKKTIYYTIFSCAILGLAFAAFFFISSNMLGELLFKNMYVSSQIRALSFLCPFLYLSGTLSSILHGLGKTTSTFAFSTISITLRLLFVLFLVPHYGFFAYIIGSIFSQILLDILIILALRKYILYN